MLGRLSQAGCEASQVAHILSEALPACIRSLASSPAAHAAQQQRSGVLAYEEVWGEPEGTPQADDATAIVVHGLLGSGRNWRTVARKLAKEAAAATHRRWRFMLPDQRNHGASARLAGFRPPHTLERELGNKVPEALIGHSLGGKTVLELLRQVKDGTAGMPPPEQFTEGLPAGRLFELRVKAWVLDANIGSTGTSSKVGDVERVLMEVRRVPLPIKSREALYEFMEKKGFSEGLRLWMGTNLTSNGGGRLEWAFNIDGATAMFESYGQHCYWPLVRAPPKGCTLNVLRAAKSNRWPPSQLQKLQEAGSAAQADDPQHGRLAVHVLEDAGHWLHVDNPQGLHAMLLPSLTGRQT